MKIGVPKETQQRETRVAITPTIAKQLKAKGFEIVVESGAGEKSFFSDGDYTQAGAVIGAKANAYGCDIVAKINAPTEDEAKLLKAGSTLISLLFAATNMDVVKTLAEHHVKPTFIHRSLRADSHREALALGKMAQPAPTTRNNFLIEW